MSLVKHTNVVANICTRARGSWNIRPFLLRLLAASLCTASFLHAQDIHASINGQVTDPSGAAVPGVAIRALNTATQTTVGTTSNPKGIYNLPFLTPGVYTVTAEIQGFKKSERPNIELRVNDAIDIDMHLEVGNTSESITVDTAPALLDTETASQGEVVDTRRIQDLPLQAGNAEEMILFAPGVVNSTNLRARKTSFNSASSQFVTDGNQLYSNETTIDGVPDTFASNGTPLVAFQPPQFAVSEFRVLTAGYDAAAGHATGSVVNLVTAGGTDKFHGEIHDFFSNSYLDSSTFFQERAGLRKPEYQDNRYGASIGGPAAVPHLFKGDKKTFFFYAWEANKWGKPVTTVGTVPTDAEKNGDFSALLGLGSNYQIYDPATTTAVAGGHFTRTGFAGNKIPSFRIDPVAKQILNYYAEPNTNGSKTGQLNYTQSIKDVFDYYVHFVRIDHAFSDRNRMFARFDYDHYLETDPGFYNNISGGVNLTRINRGAAVDDVIVLSPSNVLDLRYGVTDEEAPEYRISKGFNLSSLGFSPNLLALLNPARQTFPNIYLNTKANNGGGCSGACTGTYSGFGNFNNGDGAITGFIHQFAGTLNTTRASHDLHIGGEFRLYRSFGNNAPFDVSPGYQFLATYTDASDTASAAPIGQELAALELGIPTTGQMTRSTSYAMQSVYGAGYIQDNWKVNHRLTLNAGIRLEHESPVTERFNRSVRGFDYTSPSPIATQAIANYSTNPSSLLPASQFQVKGGLLFASSSTHNLWDQPGVTILPRAGFAFDIDPNTVLRGGYGIFYDTIGVNRSPVIQTGFTSSTPIIPSLDNGLHFVASLANPFPNGLLPSAGSASGLSTNLGQTLSFYPTNRLQPYAQRASLSLQHMFGGGILFDLAYVGNKATHLPVSTNINATPQQYLSLSPVRDTAVISRLSATIANPFLGTNPIYTSKIAVSDLLRPFPQFGDITRLDNNGYSWYHSMQVRVEKRFSHGYTLNAAYTWSRYNDATSYLNAGDTTLNRSISQYDRPQRIVVSGIWDLPVGRGKAYLRNLNRGVDVLIGGWQLNTSFERQSGAPLSFGDVIFNGGDLNQIALASGNRSVDHWFNTALFQTASTAQRQFDIRTFPKYISSVRGPNQDQLNGSAFKTVKFGGSLAMQLRVECYDITNHENFDAPNTTPTSSSFGIVSTQGSPGRQIQAALRLFF
jgi:hypothetical protein